MYFDSRSRQVESALAAAADGACRAVRFCGCAPVFWMVLLVLLHESPTWAGSPADSLRRWPLCQIEQALASTQNLRLLARLVSLSGEQLLHGRPLSLRLHGRPLRCEPPGCVLRRKRFAEQHEQPLEVALLLEATLPYQPLFADMQAALSDFIAQLPPESRLRIFLVSAEPPGQPPPSLLSAPDAVSALMRVRASGDIEVRLVDTIQAALAGLRRPLGPGSRRALPSRKVLVVMGGGLDTIMVPKRFAQLGDELAQAGIPLFSIALSPKNYQLPMLNLAELSFRSAGTFRWVRLLPESTSRELLHEQLTSLAEELNTTELLTFSGPRIRELLTELPAGAALSLDCGDTVSRECPIRHVPGVRAAAWGPLVVLLGLAGMVLLAALGWWRRQRALGSSL